MSANIEASDSACVVCFKAIEIYSVGECDHPVCFECSTRMRVLCLQTECPICRQDLSKVIFSTTSEPYKKFKTRNMSFERKYKICFANEKAREAYQTLLEHHCLKCPSSSEPFKTFQALKVHLQKEHELHFCDLCIENLKIFTSERKCYTRQQLGLHRRKGDIDDTSHKGHPLCEFCDQRYMDTDELYRHLRKDHLYCHLCDTDGLHQFYGSYKTLRDHFRQDHYLCEEDECGAENLTGVFRSDIDLKAHKAMEHGKGLSKQAARQARTLELQFTLTPRLTRTLPPPHHSRAEQEPVYEPPQEEPPMVPYSPSIDTGSTEQFPTLGGEGGAPVVPGAPSRPAPLRQNAGALVRTEQNFPSLAGDAGGGPSFRVNITHQPGPSNAVIRTSAKPNVSIQVHNRPASSANRFSLTETSDRQLAMRLADRQQQVDTSRRFQEEFPSLSKKDRTLLMDNHYTSYQPPTSTIAKKISAAVPAPQPPAPAPVRVRAPPPTMDAFPALHSAPGTPPPTQPQWVTSRPKEPAAPKPPKAAAPAPQLPVTADFPVLKSKQKKKNSGAAAANAGVVRPEEAPNNNNNNCNNNNISTKKDKKKNKCIESSERPPDSVPPDFSIKNKINNKENSKNVSEGSKKKNNAPLSESKDKKNANMKNGHIQEKVPDKLQNSNEKSNSVESKRSSKNSLVGNLEGEFPSLAIGKPSGQKAKTKPPPGFGKQPPGLQRSVPPCNGFTFTSSSGQSYSIPAHNYVQPMNFYERNKSLVIKFTDILDSAESFSEFKQLSQMFREGNYSSDSYYKHCIGCMGNEFDAVFPELLALLPDIGKQQELHQQLVNAGGGMAVCGICGQVLMDPDVPSHAAYHTMQATFPALGARPSGPQLH